MYINVYWIKVWISHLVIIVEYVSSLSISSHSTLVVLMSWLFDQQHIKYDEHLERGKFLDRRAGDPSQSKNIVKNWFELFMLDQACSCCCVSC